MFEQRLLAAGGALLDLLPDAILVRRVGTNEIEYWSAGAEELYGWSRHQALGQVSHALLRTCTPRPLDDIETSLHTTERWVGELQHTRRDGQQIVVASRWVLQRNEQGEPVAVLETNTDVTAEVRARQRTAALLRAAHALASTPDESHLLERIGQEAVSTLGADFGTVHRWDDELEHLSLVWSSLPAQVAQRIALLGQGQGVAGRAALSRTPVAVEQYQGETHATTSEHSSPRSVLAVPIQHEGRLLGTFSVGTWQPAHQFLREDVEFLELLASTAAALLVGMDAARLDGVLLAARTAEHELFNRLTATSAYLQLLATRSAPPEQRLEWTNRALVGVQAAVVVITRLGRVARLHESRWGPALGPTINLPRSIE